MKRRHPLAQLILARLREFYREPEVIFWVYGFPLLLACGLGIAFSGKTPQPPAIDVQGSPGQTDAEELAKLLKDKGLKVEIHGQAECEQRMSTGKTSLFLVPGNPRQLVYDNTREDCVLAFHWVDDVLVRAASPNLPAADAKTITTPGDRYIDFLLPGILGMNLMGGGLWGVGFVIVDMRVRKLLKRFLATPMRRGDFLLSIMSARLVFMFPEMALLLLFGCWLVFDVPIRCSLVTLAVVIVIGAATFAGIGLLVACRPEKTETVSGLMNLVMLPMWLLSGIFFSSERFPEAVQPLIQALPLTQLNNALREAMLQGKPLTDIAWRLGILALWGGVSFTLALRWFKWR
jgi:ABC-2 type transport system permease protein